MVGKTYDKSRLWLSGTHARGAYSLSLYCLVERGNILFLQTLRR